MSKRILENWLAGYTEYTEQTESSPLFHTWCGISTIASALQKKVRLEHGRLKIYPNLYIILVAEPGVARKTQAIDYSIDIMSSVDNIIRAADATTRESLIQAIEGATHDQIMPDGTVLKHNSLTIVSRELEDFIGNKKENHRMVTTLTALFDCGSKPWIYQTKNSGTNKLSAVFVNLIAATTPESLASCMPSAAIGGGLTSRVLFIYTDERNAKYAKPPKPPEILYKALVQDLEIISRISGTYTLSSNCERKWEDWYNTFDGELIHRICKDRVFNAFYSRKSTLILKVAQSLSAAKSSSVEINWNTLEEAITLVEEIEGSMDKAFAAVGRSDITVDVTAVCNIIERHGKISEKQLLHLVHRDMDAAKFDNVISTAIRCGDVVRDIKSDKVMYYSTHRKGDDTCL